MAASDGVWRNLDEDRVIDRQGVAIDQRFHRRQPAAVVPTPGVIAGGTQTNGAAPTNTAQPQSGDSRGSGAVGSGFIWRPP